jgi:hypothetical protein
MASKKSSKKAPSTKKTAGKRIPADEIQEVTDFLDIEQELQTLRADNPEVFRQLSDIVERYNAALELAEKAVRSLEVSCGPFDCYSSVPVYSGERMYEELGERLFLACGGTTVKSTDYKVDKAKVEAAIASGKVPADCVGEFKSIRLSYHKPPSLCV